MASKDFGEYWRPCSFMLCSLLLYLGRIATVKNGLEGCAIKALARVFTGLIIMCRSLVVKTVSFIHYSCFVCNGQKLQLNLLQQNGDDYIQVFSMYLSSSLHKQNLHTRHVLLMTKAEVQQDSKPNCANILKLLFVSYNHPLGVNTIQTLSLSAKSQPLAETWARNTCLLL